MNATRRRFLAATTTLESGLFSGCSAPENAEGETGTLYLQVRNQSEEQQLVSMTVTDEGGDVVDRIDDRELPAGVSETFESSDHPVGRYSYEVQGGDWATGGVWDAATCTELRSTTTLEILDATPSVTNDVRCLTES